MYSPNYSDSNLPANGVRASGFFGKLYELSLVDTFRTCGHAKAEIELQKNSLDEQIAVMHGQPKRNKRYYANSAVLALECAGNDKPKQKSTTCTGPALS